MRAIFWKWWYCLTVSFCILYAAKGIHEAHGHIGMFGGKWVLAIALVIASAIVAPEFGSALSFGSRAHGKRDATERRQRYSDFSLGPRERRDSFAKYSLYFYVLFAGLLVFADASHKGDYLQMLFGLMAIPSALTSRSFLRRTRGKSP